MAYTTIQTLTGVYGGALEHAVTLDFERFQYRFYALDVGGVGSRKIVGRREGVYVQEILVNYVKGNYYPVPTMVGSGSYAFVMYGSYDVIQIQSEPKNSAPTIPGVFTQPTGTLETGDAKVISWGASTDAESNLSKYILEASINGGAFAVIAQPTMPTFSYTVPTATSVKFRVKAVDAGGLESVYRDSALLTITKPMYYWGKYNVLETVTSYKEQSSAFNEKIFPYSTVLSSVFSAYGLPALVDAYRGKELNTQNGLYTGVSLTHLTGNTNVQAVVANGSPTLHYISGSIVHYFFISYWSGNDYKVNYVKWNSIPATTTESKGSLIQSNVIAAEGTYPTDGKHTDGFWYVRGSRVSQSIAPPAGFTSPAPQTSLQPKQSLTLTFGASTAPSISTYELEHRYNEGAWTPVGTHSNTLTRPFTVTENKALTKVEFRVRAKNTSNVYSDYVYSEAFIIEHNKIPTVTLNTPNNETLYENDTFKIDGSALDTDVGDILNVYYRINGGLSRAIATGISTGVFIPFNEQLTFRSGKLIKGEIEITDALAEGPAHRLEVWSEDNQGGKSPVTERAFYVVPNRAPSLTVDPFTDQSELINNDTIKLSGVSSDPDGNDVTVKYRVNEQAAVQIHSGVAGPWSFDVSLKSLKFGENIIVVEVTDTYNFKSSRTIKLNKIENLTPLEHSVQRYKIVPPSGSAQGVLLWIQRDADQEVTAEISMTIGTEQEQFVPLPLDSTVSMGEDVEDYFKYRADTPAEHIALKLSWTGDKPITFISGALLQ